VQRATIITLGLSSRQGRNEVKWRKGQEASLAPPMFKSELFRKQICCIVESTCDILGFSAIPHSDLAPGNCSPLPLVLPPCPSFCPLRREFLYNCRLQNSVTLNHKKSDQRTYSRFATSMFMQQAFCNNYLLYNSSPVLIILIKNECTDSRF